MTPKPRIFTMSIARVYPCLVAKAQKKGRTQAEVDTIIRWLTGYSQKRLESMIAQEVSYEDFFKHAPTPNPARRLVKGVVCGVRVEEISNRTMRDIRCLDKLVDELARGKPMEKLFPRRPAPRP